MENTAYNTGGQELVTKSQPERGSCTDRGGLEAKDRFLLPTRSIFVPQSLLRVQRYSWSSKQRKEQLWQAECLFCSRTETEEFA